MRLAVAIAGLLLAAGIGMAPHTVAVAGEPEPRAADDEEPQQHVQALGAGFADQRAEVEAEMEEGGRYAEIGDEQRATVLRAFDRMEAIIGQAPDIHALTPEQRAELLTTQSLANTILTEAHKDSRMLCKREKVTGTRVRRNTLCHTVAHWRRITEESQQQMRLKQHGLAKDRAGTR